MASGLDRRLLVSLIGGQVCLHACMTGTRMAAPLLALKQGLSPWAVGWLLALFAVAPIALSLMAGRMADRHGYHRPVRVGVSMSVIGACVAVALQDYWALCLAALLTGGGTCFALVAIQRTAGRFARTSHELKQVFSWLAIGPALSNVIGPVAAGLLIDFSGFRAAFAFLAALPLLTLWWARQVPPEAAGPVAAGGGAARGAWELLRHAPLRRLLLVNWTLSACWDVHTFIVPVLGHERALSASAIGAILGGFSVAATAVRLVIPVIAHRVQEWQVLMVSMLATAALFALYPFMHSAWAMGACSMLLGLVLGAVQPMVMSTLHQITPPDSHGAALGLRMMAINISSSSMPLLFGAAGSLIGAAYLFWAMGVLVTAGAWMARGVRQDLAEAAGSHGS